VKKTEKMNLSEKQKTINPVFQWLCAFLAIFFVFVGVSGLYQTGDAKEIFVIKAEHVVKKNPADIFNKLELEANAVFVYDNNNRFPLYAKNAEAPFPIASVSKIMTVLAADRLLPRQTPISFNGEFWTAEELFRYALIISSNEAAETLAVAAQNFSGTVLIDEMNKLSKEIGLATATFKNPTGLDLGNGEAGAESSAADIARLIAYVLKNRPELLEPSKSSKEVAFSMNGSRYLLPNTNVIIDELPGLLASKTGFTDLAGGNLAVVFDRGLNQPVTVVVLGSSWAGRFDDVKKLFTATGRYFSND